jgi:hypothetical protein
MSYLSCSADHSSRSPVPSLATFADMVQLGCNALLGVAAEDMLLCFCCGAACLQRTWDAKDMSTQVTTPALQKQRGSTSSRASSGYSNLSGRAAAAVAGPPERAGKQMQQQGCQAGGACDVSASPVKVRNLHWLESSSVQLPSQCLCLYDQHATSYPLCNLPFE